MAILDRATEEDYFRDHKGFVFFGVRSMADGFYLEEMSRFVAYGHDNRGHTRAVPRGGSFCHPPHTPGAARHWHGARGDGKLDEERYSNVAAFVAGPPPMVDGAIRALITEGGLSPALIRYDKFG
jgi:toluene monooxygenase electron transfer component